MLCEERSPCLCSMFTSHLLRVCRPRPWAITAYYGDNYLGYSLSYFLRETSTALCEHHGATGGKNTKCRFLVERVFDGKRLAHHISHNNRSTFCNRPAALLLLFFLLSREGANGVHDKKEVVGGEQGWWCSSEYCLVVLHLIVVAVGVRCGCRRSY